MRLSLLCTLTLAVLLVLSFGNGVDATERRHERVRGVASSAVPLLDASASSVTAPDPRYKDNVADGWIARGALVAFNESVTAQMKEDWLNSLLYAQIHCRTVNGFANVLDLISCIETDLSDILYWKQGFYSSPQSIPRTPSRPLAEDALSVIYSAPQSLPFPEPYRRLARAAMESLKVTDEAYASFHNASTNGTRDVFLLSVASVVNGDLAVWTATYHVSTRAQDYQWLWTTYPQSDASISYAMSARLQYDFRWTEERREQIRKALGNFLPQSIYSKPIKL